MYASRCDDRAALRFGLRVSRGLSFGQLERLERAPAGEVAGEVEAAHAQRTLVGELRARLANAGLEVEARSCRRLIGDVVDATHRPDWIERVDGCALLVAGADDDPVVAIDVDVHAAAVFARTELSAKRIGLGQLRNARSLLVEFVAHCER